MAYSVINKSSLYQNQVLYTGNATARSITGLGFQPDLNWTKQRGGADWHQVTDVVRGTNKQIYTNVTDAEGTTTNQISSFDSDGFSTGTAGGVNGNGIDIVSWNWKANGAGSANTDGTINSTVSANTTSGFSIVKYTGTGSNGTVGHGLGVVPSLIIVKCITTASTSWTVYHASLGNTKYLVLNTNGAETTSSTRWQDTTPTSSVFSIGTSGDVNHDATRDYIAYCFAEVEGYSRFGKFPTGTSGYEFVYTGFAPQFVIAKRSGSTSNWYMFDNKRKTYNLNTQSLDADTPDIEQTLVQGYDLLSNGFVDRQFLADAGNELIYIAFGQPIISNGGVCATAR